MSDNYQQQCAKVPDHWYPGEQTAPSMKAGAPSSLTQTTGIGKAFSVPSQRITVERRTWGCPRLVAQEPETRMATPRYRHHHQRERQAWAPLVNSGTVNCWRCEQAGNPDPTIHPGEPWDLGHRPGQPSHPEHTHCNRRAGAIEGNRRRNPTSRVW